jgi:hypothetical protein
MKTFRKNTTLHLILIFLFLGIIVSCSKDKVLPLANETASLDLIVNDIGTQAEKEGKIITFDLVVDGDSFRKENVKVIQDSKFVIGFKQGYDGTGQNRGNTVDITCMYPDGTETTTTCASSNSTCIGDAVSTCLNGGGCAVLCRIQVTYYPKEIK